MQGSFIHWNYKLANFSNKRIIWQVKPYSLSYQATVFTNWKSPAVVTSVCVGSKSNLLSCRLCLQKQFHDHHNRKKGYQWCVFHCFIYLISCYFCFKMLTNSVKDPSTTGTRWAWPCNFPLSSGITKPIALAAPVEWGIVLFCSRACRTKISATNRAI